NGFTVYPHLAKALEEQKELLAKYPASAKIFLKESGEPLREGDRLVQKDLAQSLKLIARYGGKAFYNGPIGHAIVKESKRLHGILTEKDLGRYRVHWRQ